MYRQKRNTASNTALKTALFVCILAAAAMVLIFFDNHYLCYGGRIYDRSQVSMDLRGSQEIDVDRLCKMKSLELVDLRNSALTVEQAEEITRRMPECRLLWSVPLSDKTYDSGITELELTSPELRDFDMLRYFDRLEQLTFIDCGFYEQIIDCRKQMPACKVSWTVPIGSEEYSNSTTKIALPEATAEDIDMLIYLPELRSVDLSGSSAYDDIIRYSRSNQDIDVRWTVDFFGAQVASDVTEADISKTAIKDVEEFERLLTYLPKLEKLIMCDCGLDNETLDQLNKKYENIRIVWRVYFGKWSLRTDATAFSTLNPDPPGYRLTDNQAKVLRYCTDLEMLDLGHNSLTSVEPFAGLTNLKVLILADNRISDISALENLTKMEYIELFINRISDISVLRNMPNLTDVNFCWNRISDPSPLYEHEHLERVWMCGGSMSNATKREFMAALPTTEFDLHSTYGSTNGSWRYNDHFDKIRDAFHNHNGMNDYHW